MYLERAERLVQDIDELRDAVSQLAIHRGTLRIQSRTSLGTQLVAPLILLSRAVSGPQCLFVADGHGRGLNRARH